MATRTPELPPHVKEGRNEAVGRSNQRSTPRRNPRSQPGARRREERGRPSELFADAELPLWSTIIGLLRELDNC